MSNDEGVGKSWGVCVKAERTPYTHRGRLCQIGRLLGVCVKNNPWPTCHKRCWHSCRPTCLPQTSLAFQPSMRFATNAVNIPVEKNERHKLLWDELRSLPQLPQLEQGIDECMAVIVVVIWGSKPHLNAIGGTKGLESF